jgi:hypothetical protein
MGADMTEELDNDFSMKCPRCGASDRVDVQALIWLRMRPDGSDPYEAKNQAHEWTDNSIAMCCKCDHIGTVREFEADNQLATNNNDARAKRAADAVYEYVKAKGETYEESSSEVVDLITDLLHLVLKLDQGDDPVESTLRLAQMHFEAEQQERAQS